MPGAMAAFANGLHVIVVDGKEIHAGVISLKGESGSDGALSVRFPSGLEARLVAAGDGRMNLQFSGGESVPMRRR
jgi:hypothetical protein